MSARKIDLSKKNMTSDPIIKKVIDAEARVAELKRAVAALKKDRDELLVEYQDALHRRPVPKAPGQPPASKSETIRICVGDVHGMRMDRPAVEAFLKDLKMLQPDEIVLGGDILECGGWLAKHQPLGYVAETDYTYQEDVAAANWFLDELQAAAPNAVIHYIEGNHEDRVERWAIDQTMSNGRDADFLLKAFGPRSVLQLEERGIQYYRRSVTYVEGLPPGWIKLGKMYFTHTLGRGENAARQALKKTAGNVTYFCTHREDTATMSFPGIGMVKAYNPGCMCRLQPLWRHSDPTSWTHGYGIDFVTASGNFQRVHIPIWEGMSLAGNMVGRC